MSLCDRWDIFLFLFPLRKRHKHRHLFSYFTVFQREIGWSRHSFLPSRCREKWLGLPCGSYVCSEVHEVPFFWKCTLLCCGMSDPSTGNLHSRNRFPRPTQAERERDVDNLQRNQQMAKSTKNRVGVQRHAKKAWNGRPAG